MEWRRLFCLEHEKMQSGQGRALKQQKMAEMAAMEAKRQNQRAEKHLRKVSGK